MRIFLVLTLVLVACGVPASDSEPLVGGDTCVALTSGPWTFSGEAFGMGDATMGGDVTFDAEACTFTISNWSMTMDDLPTGGALDGDSVQLDGLSSRWRTCTGTAPDEDNASGTCSEDNTAWAMTSGG